MGAQCLFKEGPDAGTRHLFKGFMRLSLLDQQCSPGPQPRIAPWTAATATVGNNRDDKYHRIMVKPITHFLYACASPLSRMCAPMHQATTVALSALAIVEVGRVETHNAAPFLNTDHSFEERPDALATLSSSTRGSAFNAYPLRGCRQPCVLCRHQPDQAMPSTAPPLDLKRG